MPPIVWGVLILSAVILLPMVAVVAHAMEGKRPLNEGTNARREEPTNVRLFARAAGLPPPLTSSSG